MNIGDKVRYSGYALKPKRDYWLSRGRMSEKTTAKEHLDSMALERGIVTQVDKSRIKVTWDTGTISDCLDYIIERV